MKMDDEFKFRLSDIDEGPWAVSAQPAIRWLAGSDLTTGTRRLADWVGLNRNINLEDEAVLVLTPSEAETDTGDSARRRHLRESFRFGLSYLLLLELAVESGYLPFATVEHHASEKARILLSTTAARRIASEPGYLPVRYLAARLKLEPFREAHSEFALPNGVVPFALLLDHYRTWLQDVTIGAWFRHVLNRSPGIEERLAADLAAGFSNRSASASIRRVAAGAERSVWMLADLFDVIDEALLRMFGFVYYDVLDALCNIKNSHVPEESIRLHSSISVSVSWIDRIREGIVARTSRSRAGDSFRSFDHIDRQVLVIKRVWSLVSTDDVTWNPYSLEDELRHGYLATESLNTTVAIQFESIVFEALTA
jgi:hypothetical protein